MIKSKACVYGPVASRRLGSSLGVDVVPRKTCTFDCLYCQLGSESNTTLKRDNFLSPEAAVRGIKARLRKAVSPPDYITLGGSGEPTLNARLGEIIDAVGKNFPFPICLLTNGSLMWDQQVREECRELDLIVPNLDAPDEETFAAINHPHPSLNFRQVIDGLIKLREEFEGKIWLEIFFIPGLNDSDRHLEKFQELTDRLSPDKIHLNTAVRPPADPSVKPLSSRRLHSISKILGPNAEVIAEPAGKKSELGKITETSILQTLRRRPCTASEIATACEANPKLIEDKLKSLLSENKIRTVRRDDKTFFTVLNHKENPS